MVFSMCQYFGRTFHVGCFITGTITVLNDRNLAVTVSLFAWERKKTL